MASGVFVWWEMSAIRVLILSFSACRFRAETAEAARYRASLHSSAESRLSS